jgi:hypothetical protein
VADRLPRDPSTGDHRRGDNKLAPTTAIAVQRKSIG